MQNIHLLMAHNRSPMPRKLRFKKSTLNNKSICYQSTAAIFTLNEFQKLLSFVSSIPIIVFQSYPIIIDLRKSNIVDKLVYIMLECLCYDLINLKSCDYLVVYVSPNVEITTRGLYSSSIQELGSTSNWKQRKQVFNKKFWLNLSPLKLRKIIKQEDFNNDCFIESGLTQDIKSFLQINNVSHEYADSITTVISELVDNALEHSASDCLLDIDITPKVYKKFVNLTDPTNAEKKYFGVNVVVLNFSDVLLGEALQEKMNRLRFADVLSQRYQYVMRALNNHSQLFSSTYTEGDFFIIASYQDKVSSRSERFLGGTGLTTLLQTLEQSSDAYHCYMLTGDRFLQFQHNILNLKDGWIGFNSKNDFLNEKPDGECFKHSKLYFPGTAYNLNFVVE